MTENEKQKNNAIKKQDTNTTQKIHYRFFFFLITVSKLTLKKYKDELLNTIKKHEHGLLKRVNFYHNPASFSISDQPLQSKICLIAGSSWKSKKNDTWFFFSSGDILDLNIQKTRKTCMSSPPTPPPPWSHFVFWSTIWKVNFCIHNMNWTLKKYPCGRVFIFSPSVQQNDSKRKQNKKKRKAKKKTYISTTSVQHLWRHFIDHRCRTKFQLIHVFSIRITWRTRQISMQRPITLIRVIIHGLKKIIEKKKKRPRRSKKERLPVMRLSLIGVQRISTTCD